MSLSFCRKVRAFFAVFPPRLKRKANSASAGVANEPRARAGAGDVSSATLARRCMVTPIPPFACRTEFDRMVSVKVPRSNAAVVRPC